MPRGKPFGYEMGTPIYRTASKRSWTGGSRGKWSINQYNLQVTGLTAESGRKNIKFTLGKISVYLPAEECASAPVDICKRLNELGLQLYTKQGIDVISDMLPRVKEFPAKPVVDRPGRTGAHFALLNGRVISPNGSEKVTAIFPTIAAIHQRRGTLDGAKEVAARFDKQIIPAFTTMLPFAAVAAEFLGMYPTLGFELVAERGAHLESLLKYVATVSGSASIDPIPFRSFLEHQRELIRSHRGALLMVGDNELELAGRSVEGTKKLLRDVFSNLSSEQDPPVMFLMTGTTSLVDRVGADTPLGIAIRHRLITISVPSGRPHGVYGRLDGQNGIQFSREQIIDGDANAGGMLRVFSRRLINACAKDEARVAAKIDELISEFRELVDADLNDDAITEQVDAFGFVSAIARLAQSYGALPESWDCQTAVALCFQRFHVGSARQLSDAELLADTASHPDTVHLQKGQPIEADVINAAGAFVRHHHRSRHLLLRPDWVKEHPDFQRRMRTSGMRARMISPKAQKVRLRYGRGHAPERAYEFRLDT